jgi:organic hydroperoxide reductase OsmC/OhrA
MAKHTAVIEWVNDNGGFGTGRYSRAHSWTFDGGAVVRASSSPDVVPLPFSDPAGVDPEEALVAAASSCHMLWFLSLAAGKGLDIVHYRDAAEGHMGRNALGRIAMVRIVLKPAITFHGRRPEAAELRALHEAAHDKCFVAASLVAEIIVAGPDAS